MITLKTLPQATAQEVFNQVVNHLRAQGCKSMHAGLCVYRAEGGLKCAAGCLMSDEEAAQVENSIDWYVLKTRGQVPEDHFSLISALQDAHDFVNPTSWEEKFQELAAKFEVTYTPPINPQEN